MRLEVAGDGRGPLDVVGPEEPRGDPLDAELLGDGQGDVGDQARLDREPVVGRGPGVGVGRLGDVEAVHDPFLRGPLRREGPLVGDPARGAAGEEVGLQGEDDVGPVEAIDGVDDLAEGELRAGPGGVLVDGVVAVPLRLGERGEELLDLAGEAGRADRAAEDPEARPLVLAEPVHRLGDRGEEVVPGVDLAEVEHHLGSVGVVEREGRRLHVDVGRAEARRVIGVALDLGRAAGVALHQDPGPQAVHHHRRGEELGTAGDDVLGGLDPRDDLLGRPDGTPGDAGQRQRGAHHLEEGAAAVGVGQVVGVVGELPMEIFPERVGPGRLLQAPPVFRAGGRGQPLPDLGELDREILAWRSHRWQIEQLSSRPTSIP